jgi:hypothetical protein
MLNVLHRVPAREGSFCLNRKLASSTNLESGFPLQFNLPYFIQKLQSADLQHSAKARTWWKYFATPDKAPVLK